MLIYAGIDEAGYGPMFGPMVIARTVFRIEKADPNFFPPPLWSLLPSLVCRRITDKKRRIAINDSKALYSPALGLGHLERGVLAFLGSVGCRPESLEDLLESVGFDPLSRGIPHPWYTDVDGTPQLPAALEIKEVERACRRVSRTAEREGIALVDASAAVVFEERFNRMIAECGSKGACSWQFVAGHLRTIWERFGQHCPHVVIDRQGGRRYYRDQLAELFPAARLVVHLESAPTSRYKLREGARAMYVTVQIDAEKAHLPVALASMTAKYVRELLMRRFQRYWRDMAPQVRPTFGYFGDGRRFLNEIEPLLERLQIDRATLIRNG